MNEQTKSILASKTFWTAVVCALVPVISAVAPPVGAIISANAELICAGLGLAFGALRVVTKQPVRVPVITKSQNKY